MASESPDPMPLPETAAYSILYERIRFFDQTNEVFLAQAEEYFHSPNKKHHNRLRDSLDFLVQDFASVIKEAIEQNKKNMIPMLQIAQDARRVNAWNEMFGADLFSQMELDDSTEEEYLDDAGIFTEQIEIFGHNLATDFNILVSRVEFLNPQEKRTSMPRKKLIGTAAAAGGIAAGFLLRKALKRENTIRSGAENS